MPFIPTVQNTLPLPTLLSFAWVAFTVEVDNAFEARMPHRTSADRGKENGPWLVSHAMWWNCMRYVDEAPISVKQVERRARMETNLNGMIRWGYVHQATHAAETAGRASSKTLAIKATSKGLQARDIWRTLPEEIEAQWRQRVGAAALTELNEALAAILPSCSAALPDCLPILGYGLRCPAPLEAAPSDLEPANPADLPLQVRLARTLLAFTLEYEDANELSLAISANVLRLADDATPVRTLPLRSGVSKEAIEMAIGYLEKRGMANLTTKERVRVLTLTPSGHDAKAAYETTVRDIETRWRSRYGDAAVTRLRKSLERIVAGPAGADFLTTAIAPPPQGWRAALKPPDTLPRQPMVLHRGGYPDGS